VRVTTLWGHLVGYSQNDSHDFYHDDPTESAPKSIKRKLSPILSLVLLLVGGTYLVQTTLAANIALNTGAPIEFGQGVTATSACSGATDLTITPNSTFTNASGAGDYYFSSVNVSNIPSGCYGQDFIINAYGNTDASPLALFNSTSKSAVVYNNSGTFELGVGSVSGASITSGSGTFTVTFTNPVATSGSVFKITLQSGGHTAVLTCATGGTCIVGDTGPGGGKVFYVAGSPFACGPTRSATCTYLEAAPALWNAGAAEPSRQWAQSTPVNYASTIVNNVTSPETATETAIGWGYRNTRAIILQGNSVTATSASALADSFAVTVSGVAYDDWYLPSKDELNQMCKWEQGVTGDALTNLTTVCAGGTLNSGMGAAGFVVGSYLSSSEFSQYSAYSQYFSVGGQGGQLKSNSNYVRPVRAF